MLNLLLKMPIAMFVYVFDIPCSPPGVRMARPIHQAEPEKDKDSLEGLVRTLISQINNSDWLDHNPPTGEVIFVPEPAPKQAPITFSMDMLTPKQRQLMEAIEAQHLSNSKKE